MESSRTISDSFDISKGANVSTYHSSWQNTVNVTFCDKNVHNESCEVEVKVPYALAEELALAITGIVAEQEKEKAKEAAEAAEAKAEAEAEEVSAE